MKIYILAGMLACAMAAGVAQDLDPYIAYVYPAGGQQGTTFQVVTAGQRLNNTKGVFVTGTGVQAKVIRYVGPGGPLNQEQQDELKRRLREIVQQRLREGKGNRQKNQPQPPAQITNETMKTTQAEPDVPEDTKPRVKLPDLPELRNLEQLTLKQLREVGDKLLNPARRPKAPMAEEVTLEVTIDPAAAPGDRELRLRTPTGLTNPLVFQVGTLPEQREPDTHDDAAPVSPLNVPVVLNGQIMPGGVDRFCLQLHRGQQLTMVAEARYLMPYLADAVPGWFQAVLALYDPSGKEVAFQDDCGFDPDPVLTYQVPQDGVYQVEMRDAIYRGRQDFVYRIVIGEQAQLRACFPTGSRGGVAWGTPAAAQGHPTMLWGDKLPRRAEVEPNEALSQLKPVSLPHVIDGCITRPGDTDLYQFTGRAGEEVVVEVCARRMGSPLDSLVRIADTSGHVLAWNDDYKDPGCGLLTNQADSYVTVKLPANGTYIVQVTDAQRHGGKDHVYAVRIGPRQPDFTLFMTPASINVPAGRAALFTVTAVRRDGWNGDIEVVLKDAPAGFTLSGALIPAGHTSVRMTLSAPRKQFDEPLTFSLEGRAIIGNAAITRPVIPAEQMMQAFAIYHLVPARQLAVMVNRGWITMSLPLAATERLRIPAGGRAQITCTIRPLPDINLHLELSDPPAGITLQEVKTGADNVTLVFAADEKHVGYADNLIVEAFTEVEIKNKDGKVMRKQRIPVGTLPAIPMEIVAKQ